MNRRVTSGEGISVNPTRILRVMQARQLFVGLGLAVDWFFWLLGILLLTAWSYSVWGSASSPLRHLFWPGVGLMLVSVVIRLVLRGVMRWTHRTLQLQRRRSEVQRRVRATREIRKMMQSGDDNPEP